MTLNSSKEAHNKLFCSERLALVRLCICIPNEVQSEAQGPDLNLFGYWWLSGWPVTQGRMWGHLSEALNQQHLSECTWQHSSEGVVREGDFLFLFSFQTSGFLDHIMIVFFLTCSRTLLIKTLKLLYVFVHKFFFTVTPHKSYFKIFLL